MEDHELDTLLADASRTYRVAPTPPLDPLWESIEARAFAPAPRVIGWGTLAAGGARAPPPRPAPTCRSFGTCRPAQRRPVWARDGGGARPQRHAPGGRAGG